MTIDYAHPLAPDLYDSATNPDVLEYIRDNMAANSKWLEGIDPAGKQAGFKRLNAGNIEEWNGTAWVAKPLAYVPMTGAMNISGSLGIQGNNLLGYSVQINDAPVNKRITSMLGSSNGESYFARLNDIGTVMTAGLKIGADGKLYDILSGQLILSGPINYLPLTGGTLTGPFKLNFALPYIEWKNPSAPANKRLMSLFIENNGNTGFHLGDDTLPNSNVYGHFKYIQSSAYWELKAPGGGLAIADTGTGSAIVMQKPAGGNGECSIYFNTGAISRCRIISAANNHNLNVDFFNAAGAYTGNALSLLCSNNAAVFPGAAVQIGTGTDGTLAGGAANTSLAIYPAYSATIGGPGAWPTTNGGMIAVRGSSHSAYSQGPVSCFSGSGNTGVSLANGANAWGGLSDERLKNIDSEVTGGLEAVLAMRPIRFRYKTEEADAPMHIGLTAQSVQPYVHEAIDEAPQIGPDGQPTVEKYLQLRLQEVIPHMVAAIKELAARVQVLEQV